MKNSPYWAYITPPTPSVQMSQVLNLDIKSFISKNKFQMAHAGSRVKQKEKYLQILLAVNLLLAGLVSASGSGIKYQIFGKTAKTSALSVNSLLS